MVKKPRKGMLFGAAALLAGVALGAVGMMSLRGGDGPYASSPPSARSMGAASAPAAASTYVKAVSVNCEMAPILPAGGDGDGRVPLQARPAAASGNEVASLILGGKEAAAAGRKHDAEVSFLNACRNAAVLQEGEGIPLADAMYQLARHYATVAAFGSPKSRELLQRAERLYSASLEGYRARLGPAHEKTKFAQEGLITVQQGTGTAVVAKGAPAAGHAAPTAPSAAPAPVPPSVATAPAAAPAAATPAPAQASAAPPRERVAAAAPEAEQAQKTEQPAPHRTSPSFNCASARSTTEKLICGDEELARLDRELGGLHQRAKQAAADPRAFQKNSDAEWQRREQTCRDRECLLRWYAQRRAELSASARRPQPADTAAAEPKPATPQARSTTADARPARTAPADAAAQEDAAPPPRPQRPARVAAPDPEFEAPPPPPASAMGNGGEVPTAEGSAGAP